MNCVKYIAALHGLTLGEPFRIVDRDGQTSAERYRFSVNSGVEFELSRNRWQPDCDTVLQDIVMGKLEIIREENV